MWLEGPKDLGREFVTFRATEEGGNRLVPVEEERKEKYGNGSNFADVSLDVIFFQ